MKSKKCFRTSIKKYWFERKSIQTPRIISLCVMLMLFSVLIITSACSKSDAVLRVESQISDLGTISLDSKGAIESAVKAYELLSLEEKGKVKNYSLLEDARIEYVNLCISSIGEVTPDSLSAIENAKEAYEELPNDLKEKITDYSVLADAEDKMIGMDIVGTWNGSFAARSIQYVFTDKTYTVKSENTMSGAGTYTYDGEYLTFTQNSGQVSTVKAKIDGDNMVITSNLDSKEVDIYLSRQK